MDAGVVVEPEVGVIGDSAGPAVVLGDGGGRGMYPLWLMRLWSAVR
jgi:hypothetical protein